MAGAVASWGCRYRSIVIGGRAPKLTILRKGKPHAHAAARGIGMCAPLTAGPRRGGAADAAQPLKPYRPFDGL